MRVWPVAALLALAGCGGGERQDARAPSGEFALAVTRAAFPERQSIAQPARLRLDVVNEGARTVPDVAVTVETLAPAGGRAQSAFGIPVDDPALADPERPVWILDEGPRDGDGAYTSTWAVGPLAAGASRRLEWRVTAVRPGRHTLTWRLAPALVGDARLTGDGRTKGSFQVTIDDAPVPARVGGRGDVVRGASTGE